jgi:saccharopine dehydrogenase-like NADP-dependent oxidoreductase
VTYVIAGLGGVGRGIARRMVERGAHNLLLLSRSSTTKSEVRDLLSELEARGAQVKAPVCDITDKAKLRAVLDQYSESMPPVAGCIQTTMIMTVR